MVENFDLGGKIQSALSLDTSRCKPSLQKSLGTDKAWEQFDALEENYYNKTQTVFPTGEELMAPAVIEAHRYLSRKTARQYDCTPLLIHKYLPVPPITEECPWRHHIQGG